MQGAGRAGARLVRAAPVALAVGRVAEGQALRVAEGDRVLARVGVRGELLRVARVQQRVGGQEDAGGGVVVAHAEPGQPGGGLLGAVDEGAVAWPGRRLRAARDAERVEAALGGRPGGRVDGQLGCAVAVGHQVAHPGGRTCRHGAVAVPVEPGAGELARRGVQAERAAGQVERGARLVPADQQAAVGGVHAVHAAVRRALLAHLGHQPFGVPVQSALTRGAPPADDVAGGVVLVGVGPVPRRAGDLDGRRGVRTGLARAGVLGPADGVLGAAEAVPGLRQPPADVVVGEAGPVGRGAAGGAGPGRAVRRRGPRLGEPPVAVVAEALDVAGGAGQGVVDLRHVAGRVVLVRGVVDLERACLLLLHQGAGQPPGGGVVVLRVPDQRLVLVAEV